MSARQREGLKIGIALSGGGIRAAVFHLGVLSQLAAENLLERITTISTVSGGSLIMGLLYSIGGNSWPTSQFFQEECIPAIRDRLTSRNSIQRDLISSFAWRPWKIHNRNANHLAESIRRCWGVEGHLNELPTSPRWIINATTYETGKNWRFVPHRSMGDYSIGYVRTPSLPIAEAMAASAAVPGLIGPYVLNVKQHQWYNFSNRERVASEPNFEQLHLWDGSVYDFLGTEPLFKPSSDPFPPDVNYLIVSDAAQPMHQVSGGAPLHVRAHRLVTIATDQVRSLRTRTMMNYFRQKPGSGAFLKIGSTNNQLVGERTFGAEPTAALNWSHQNSAAASAAIRRAEAFTDSVAAESTSSSTVINSRDAEWAASMETTLRQITQNEFELLFQHGWEVARYSVTSVGQSN